MTTPEIIATTTGIAEAPCAIGEQLWFSDLLHGVFVVDAARKTATVSNRRGVGGLVPHVDGGVVASGRSLIHLHRDGKHTELLARPEGTTGFNDLISTEDGDLIAGVLTYRPLAGEPPTPGWLLRLGGPARSRLLATGPAWPNGIGTADGTEFYVADLSTGDILTLLPDGRLRLLATLDEGHADGMAVDTLGRIWVETDARRRRSTGRCWAVLGAPGRAAASAHRLRRSRRCDRCGDDRAQRTHRPRPGRCSCRCRRGDVHGKRSRPDKTLGEAGLPPDVHGWQLTAGGIVLLPVALAVEGAPQALTLVELSGYLYLSVIGSAAAYASGSAASRSYQQHPWRCLVCCRRWLPRSSGSPLSTKG
jgi:hypothetical protein